MWRPSKRDTRHRAARARRGRSAHESLWCPPWHRRTVMQTAGVEVHMLKGLSTGVLEVQTDKGISQALRGAWLQIGSCVPGQECYTDQIHLLMLLMLLILAIVSMLCAFGFFREELFCRRQKQPTGNRLHEWKWLPGSNDPLAQARQDKDEMFTPLTPQLVVKKEAQLTLRLPYDTQEDSFSITRLGGEVFCKVEAEWPDPFRDSSASAAGVLGTIKIQSARGNTIALVRARHSTMGQSLQLCRPTVHDYMTDMFAFVEPEGENRFCIRHRTGYPLLTLQGNFQGPGS
eukprot:g18845.t1